MDQPGHTPGPWSNGGRYTERGFPHSMVGADTLIARVFSKNFGDVREEVANANLIAAAPDMLAALKRVIQAAEDGDEMTAISMAEAAIAKAEGR